MMIRRRIRWGVVALAAVLTLDGCGPANRLHDIDFDDRTVFVVAEVPASLFLSRRKNPIIGVQHTPTYMDDAPLYLDLSFLVPTKRKQIRARLDSALAFVDVAARIARRTTLGAARDLGYRLAEDTASADYLLHLDVRDYGFFMNRHVLIDFWINADIRLIDRHDERRVWERKVQEFLPASAVLEGLRIRLGYRTYEQVETLAGLTVEEMTALIEHVADITAATLLATLRDDHYARR